MRVHCITFWKFSITLCFLACRSHSPAPALKPTIIDMTTACPRKVIPVDTIQAQHVGTSPYEPKKEEKCGGTSPKGVAAKSEDSRKRRKRAKRKPRNERPDSQAEDREVLLTQQLSSSDEETAETLLPLQRSHDQSCDDSQPGSTLYRSENATGGSASSSTSTKLSLLNSERHSTEGRGAAADSQTVCPQDMAKLVQH